jgi:predicted DNA-binding protein (MmcQ/YjbR family)
MKYYSDDKTKDLRIVLEKKILRWPYVNTKKMFGCPCYKAKERLFAFLVTSGIVITQLKKKDREQLSDQLETAVFQAGKKRVRIWIRVHLKNKKELEQMIPYIRKSYNVALGKT